MCYYSHCIMPGLWVSALDFVVNFHYLEFIFQAPVRHERCHKQAVESSNSKKCDSNVKILALARFKSNADQKSTCQSGMLVGLTSFKFSTGTIWAMESTRILQLHNRKKPNRNGICTIYVPSIWFAARFNKNRFGNRCNTCAKCKNLNPFPLVGLLVSGVRK